MNYHYKIKFYNEDGSFLDRDGFTIYAQDVDDPEYERDLAAMDAEDKAEEMMIDYDAHSYELMLEDVG